MIVVSHQQMYLITLTPSETYDRHIFHRHDIAQPNQYDLYAIQY